MYSPGQIIKRGILTGLLAAVLGAGALLTYVHWYTGTDRILPGVQVGDTRVGGLRPHQAQHLLGSAPLRRPDEITGAAAVPDTAAALRTATAVGRRGSLTHRTWVFLAGVIHGHQVPLHNQAQLFQRPEATTPEGNPPARDGAADPAMSSGRSESAEPKPDLKAHRLARFTTPILSADAGRVKNIATAISKISGTVLKPGEIFSFNDLVGPRDEAHGWAQANELYQGEYVLGYGGGICQVSSTLYNAVLLAGLEIKERYHHDRPLQYVSPGRDATVVYNVLDFKFRNSSAAAVVIEARILDGSPRQIEVSVHGPAAPQPDRAVRLEDADVRFFPPDIVETPDPALDANQRVVVDEGYYGIEVKIYRIFDENGRQRRELVSHDRYRPKEGKVRVGVGNAPGSKRSLDPRMQ